MLRENFLQNKLKAGKIVLGTWAVIPSPVVAEVIASSGLDFIIIDSEHGPINYETAQNMAIACELHGVSPILRVSGVVESDILKALDIGVHGLHIPNITSKQQIEMSIRFMKYPPIGNRGFSPFNRAGCYSLENAQILTKTANDSTLLVIHMEGKEAIENIEEILVIKEIDVVFVGLFDISKSLGLPGEVNNPKVIKLLKKVVEKVNNVGKYTGTIVNDPEKMKQFVDYGIRYITYSVDCHILRDAYRQIDICFKSLNG